MPNILSPDLMAEAETTAVFQAEYEDLYRSLFDNMEKGAAFCRVLFQGGQAQDVVFIKANAMFCSLVGQTGIASERTEKLRPGLRELGAALLALNTSRGTATYPSRAASQ